MPLLYGFRIPCLLETDLFRWKDLSKMSSEGDRSREHLGVCQPNKTTKKKSRKPIDPENTPGFLSSASECITHDTHLLAIPFGTVDPWRRCFLYFTVIAFTTLQEPTFTSYSSSTTLIDSATQDETSVLAPR